MLYSSAIVGPSVGIIITSAVDWLISKLGTNFGRNSKFHIRMAILCQLRDSVTPALERHMDHLAYSIAKRENWFIGREGIPVDDSSGGKCEPVIVFECMDLSIGQRVNVSGLSCVSNKVLRCWDSYKVICNLIHH